MSEKQTKRGGLGPYEPGYSIVAAMARNPAASFFYIVAGICLVFGAVRLMDEPPRKYDRDFEVRQTRVYIQGVSYTILSGFLFVSGSIHATRRKD